MHPSITRAPPPPPSLSTLLDPHTALDLLEITNIHPVPKLVLGRRHRPDRRRHGPLDPARRHLHRIRAATFTTTTTTTTTTTIASATFAAFSGLGRLAV